MFIKITKTPVRKTGKKSFEYKAIYMNLLVIGWYYFVCVFEMISTRIVIDKLSLIKIKIKKKTSHMKMALLFQKNVICTAETQPRKERRKCWVRKQRLLFRTEIIFIQNKFPVLPIHFVGNGLLPAPEMKKKSIVKLFMPISIRLLTVLTSFKFHWQHCIAKILP